MSELLYKISKMIEESACITGSAADDLAREILKELPIATEPVKKERVHIVEVDHRPNMQFWVRLQAANSPPNTPPALQLKNDMAILIEYPEQAKADLSPRTFTENEPSDHFHEAFSEGGTMQKRCGYCGRQFIATFDLKDPLTLTAEEQKDDETNELGHWRKWIEDTGQEGIEQDCSSIGWATWAGRDYVYGCPCNAGAAIENLIWEDRFRIMKYLTLRAAAWAKRAAETSAAVIKVKL